MASGIPTIILAGAEYGSGSSRDWAAKGPRLLGVRCVIAVSYERIHRSNLVGMGLLPLQFENGETAETLGLTGKDETFSINLDDLKVNGHVKVNVLDIKTRQVFCLRIHLCVCCVYTYTCVCVHMHKCNL